MNSVALSLGAFIPMAALLAITPGLDTALVLRSAVTGGARQGARAALGIATGCLLWAALVALGLGMLLAASQRAYDVLRWIGAAYLFWIGLGLMRHPRAQFLAQAPQDPSPRAAFASGVLTNLLNPKVGIFYVSFLPQFVPDAVPVGPYILLLGAIHALLGLLWFAGLIAATRPVAGFLRTPTVVRACDRLTGAVFIAFGAALAVSSRRS